MSLRRALDVLPDDRATASAARQVVAFVSAHPEDELTASRVSRATGVSADRVSEIMGILEKSFVLDCAGSEEPAWVFSPTTLLTLEVQRYLRSSSVSGSTLQQSTERFRSRFGGVR